MADVKSNIYVLQLYMGAPFFIVNRKYFIAFISSIALILSLIVLFVYVYTVQFVESACQDSFQCVSPSSVTSAERRCDVIV